MTRLIAALGVCSIVLLAVAAAGAQEEPLDPRIAAYDKGPAKIDVSNYPADMKERYKLFSVKCSKCHTLARSINADLVLEEDWERQISLMMGMAPSLISPEEARLIFEFVTYDSKTRKSEQYNKAKEANPSPAS